MQDQFLKLYDALGDHEKDAVVYQHPDYFNIAITWNDVKKAIDAKSALANIALLAFVRAGIINE